MFYHEYPPPPSLQLFIQCFWMLEHDYRQPFHTHEHLWADTHVELIFSFGEPYYQRRNNRKQKLPKNFIIGPSTKELLLYSDGFTGFIAARFHPWGFTPFSKQPATTLVNAILPAAKALNHPPQNLQEQGQTCTREKRLRLLTEYLTTTKPKQSPDNQLTRAIATQLKTTHGVEKITRLATQFKINPRKLERDFLQHIGLPAKLFARILRFNHARELIQQNPNIGLAALAYETGYADQAHFSKNFKQLFNFTPAEFKARIKTFNAETSGLDRDVVFVQDQGKPIA